MSVEITSLERILLVERYGRSREHWVALAGGVTLAIIGLIWAVFPPNAGLSAMPLDQSFVAFTIAVSGLGAVLAVVATAAGLSKSLQKTAEIEEPKARTRMVLACVVVTCAPLNVLGGLLFATQSVLKVQA
ncbi:MAG: hypothetical protein AAGA78_13210 [Pseudomonadota bacterium]